MNTPTTGPSTCYTCFTSKGKKKKITLIEYNKDDDNNNNCDRLKIIKLLLHSKKILTFCGLHNHKIQKVYG